MPFRFLHTADWQIGMAAAHLGARGAAVREARFAAAAAVMHVARAAGVEAIVLAGDTFENSNIPAALVQHVVDLLRDGPAPVFVLPANHDPLIARGVFDHPAWAAAAPHVTVLRSGAVIACGAADLLPCPLTKKESPDDPLATIAAPPAGAARRIRVAIAHGSLLGAGAADADLESDFPIDRAHVTRAALDFVALGHWHTPSTHVVAGVPRIAYCGSHEPTKFGETAADGSASGQCLVVTIEGPGAPPVIDVHRTAQLIWEQRSVALSAAGDVARLRATLDAEAPNSRTSHLLDLTLTGSVPMAEAGSFADLETLAAARFLYARIRRGAVQLQPGDDTWIDALPPGAAVDAARALVAGAAGTGEDAAVARRALMLLFEINAGAAR